MSHKHEQTSVIIFGTMHLEMEEYPAYTKRLGEIIEEIAPYIICSELSPEQLAGTQSCDSKPEQRDVVIPTAKRLGAQIVPIQPPTNEGLDFEGRFKAMDRELRLQKSCQQLLEFLDRLAEQEAELLRDHMKNADCIEHVQLNEYHVFPEARNTVEHQMLPQRSEFWTEWNEYFLRRIVETIDSNPGRRIMVIVGLWHKPWLWNKLKHRDDINLQNLQAFRNIRKTK